MINPRDKYLTAAGEMGSGIRILQQDLWEMIISFLISQQNNITRIKKCIENISREFGVRKTSSTGAEYYAFPTAEALALATEEQLRLIIIRLPGLHRRRLQGFGILRN